MPFRLRENLGPIALLVTLAPALVATASDAGAQSLRGSQASVRRMHRYATANHLSFLRTGGAVRSAAAGGDLVRLRTTKDLAVGAVAHPYVRRTTALFINRLAGQYRDACGRRLVVTGATRPLSVRLANASKRSVHPTGIAIDLRRPTGRCLAWLRSTLLSLEAKGVIEATEERRPPHFHVVVFEVPYRKYLARRGVLASASSSTGATR